MSAQHTPEVMRAYHHMRRVGLLVCQDRATGLDFYAAREAYFAAIANATGSKP